MNWLLPVRNKVLYLLDILRLTAHIANWTEIFKVMLFPGNEHTLLLNSGPKIIVNRHLEAHIVKEVFVDGDYNIDLSSPKWLIDIGANIGTFSVLFALRHPESTIFAYEPDTSTVVRLRKNIDINRLDNVRVYELAVSGKPGTRVLKKSIDSGLSSLYDLPQKEKEVGIEKVKVTTLKNIILDNNLRYIDLAKIDCEGSEYEILFGTPKSILGRIKNIVVEYHNNINKYSSEDLVRFLRNNNFEITLKENPRSKNVGIIHAMNKN